MNLPTYFKLWSRISLRMCASQEIDADFLRVVYGVEQVCENAIDILYAS